MKKKLLLFLSILVLMMPMVVWAEDPEPSPSPTTSPEITVTVEPSTIELEVGDTKTITATVSDSSKTVTWSSDDTNVATVENGKVTAKKAGTTKITATVEGKTANCSVTVKEKKEEVKEVELTLESVSIPGAKLTSAFNRDKLEYEVEITDEAKFDLTKVYVTYTHKNTDKAVGHITSKLDSKNTFKIVIQNQNDKTKTLTYTFKVVKEAANANLSKLEIVGYPFNEKFDKDTTIYTVTIPYEVTTVTVNANPEDSNSKVSPGVSFTKDDLQVGNSTKNTITIKVTNGDTSKTYKIFITRSEESTLEEKATSIITSRTTSDDYDIPDVENPDSFVNYIIITLGTLILFSIGVIGIYFYGKTSPKKMKKEIMKHKEKIDESPIVEAKPEKKKTEIEEL